MTGTTAEATEVGIAAAAAYELTYHSQISKLDDCPCALTGPYRKTGYHLVQGDLAHPNNFLPKGRKDPAGHELTPAHKRCPWWALSMFESPDQIRKRFTKAKLTVPQVALAIGDHYVRFELDSTKGRISLVAPSGHFEFFEYTAFDPRHEAEDHQRLYP